MRISSGILSIALLATGFAVAQQQPQQAQTAQQNQPFLPGPSNESQLAREVRHSILMLSYYSIFDNIYFQVNGSVVTLGGVCPPGPPWDIRSEAAAAVKHIKGVTKVVNNIKTLPLSPMDWQIRRAEVRAIYGDPEIGTRYGYQALPSIHIIVDNGNVTLTGVVDNEFDNTLIRNRANTVPNVFSVKDDLIVLHPGKKKEK